MAQRLPCGPVWVRFCLPWLQAPDMPLEQPESLGGCFATDGGLILLSNGSLCPLPPTCAQGPFRQLSTMEGGGVGTRPRYLMVCLLASRLSPLLILTLCESGRVVVVSTEPPDDLSCLTTPGVGRPRDGLLPVPGASRCTLRVHAGFADSSTDLCALGCASAGSCS